MARWAQVRYIGVSNETAYGIYKWVQAAEEVSWGWPISVGRPFSLPFGGIGFFGMTFSLAVVAASALLLNL